MPAYYLAYDESNSVKIGKYISDKVQKKVVSKSDQ